jgi:hypothetical protein
LGVVTSEYVKQKLQNLKINHQDRSLTANINQIKFDLPKENQVSLEADLAIVETETQEKVAFTAVPRISDNGKSVALGEVAYPEEQEYSSELTSALLDSASAILNLKNFDLKEMSLRLKELNVKPGKMILVADAEIREFPDAD